jgi:hypothetical protein
MEKIMENKLLLLLQKKETGESERRLVKNEKNNSGT